MKLEVSVMMNLIPYSHRRSEAAAYNPFRVFDELEKNFFSGSALAEFKTDIRDDGDSYVLEADLPGFRKEDIQIDLSDNLLTISAERHSDFEEKDKQGRFVRCERSYGSYSRSFGMDGIRTDAIEASYADGVLKLTLPKAAPAAPAKRRLEIQ